MYSQVAVPEEDIRQEFKRNHWREKPPAPKDLSEHRGHNLIRGYPGMSLGERHKPWLESLVNAAPKVALNSR